MLLLIVSILILLFSVLLQLFSLFTQFFLIILLVILVLMPLPFLFILFQFSVSKLLLQLSIYLQELFVIQHLLIILPLFLILLTLLQMPQVAPIIISKVQLFPFFIFLLTHLLLPWFFVTLLCPKLSYLLRFIPTFMPILIFNVIVLIFVAPSLSELHYTSLAPITPSIQHPLNLYWSEFYFQFMSYLFHLQNL